MSNGKTLTWVRVTEDDVWRYYGDASVVWEPKCAACRAYVTRKRRPSQETLTCWKVEVWAHGSLSDCLGALSLESLAETLVRDCSAVAKISKSEIRVERTGIPVSGYPTRETDRLLMVYAETPCQRDALRASVCHAVGADVLLTAVIPVRRGCWLYDDILGPWTKWSDISRENNGA
ncbi:MAG: hypothetical protein ACOX3V_03015 [Bacillota bacterium]|jgi:hypothetical protein